MAGKVENMKKLLAKQEQIKAEIAALHNQLKGLEMAMALLNDEDHKIETPVATRPRSKNVKETVLTLVQNAGIDGINVNGVLDNAKDIGIHLDRGSVSSLLSRMKRENVLDMVDGKYMVPSKKEGASITH